MTRSKVGLDAARVRLRGGDHIARREFLEGIDIRAPEFEDWLRAERAALESGSDGPSPATPGVIRADLARPVYLVCLARDLGPAAVFESLVADCIERSMATMLTAEVYRELPSSPSDRQIVVQVQAFLAGDNAFGIRVAIDEGRKRRALWSGRRWVHARGAPPVDDAEVLSLVAEATEAVSDALAIGAAPAGPATEAAILGRLAIRKIFSMEPAGLLAADAMLDRAFDLHPRAIFLAWKVQLRVIQRLERHVGEAAHDNREIAALLRCALELEPANSMVLAAAANALIFLEDDVGAGTEFARRSLAVNPANPFAWDCLSIAHLMDGRAGDAHQHQLTACRLAARSPIRHFWDMGLCLTSVMTGDLDLALRSAQSAAVLVPDFRPPLRYLATLHAEGGRHEQAQTALTRLGALEADFTLDQMLHDPAYPVAAMRRSGLLARARLRDLL